MLLLITLGLLCCLGRFLAIFRQPRIAYFGTPQRLKNAVAEVVKPDIPFSSSILRYISWVWVKIKPTGDRRFWSMFPLARVPFWVPMFDPQPFAG